LALYTGERRKNAPEYPGNAPSARQSSKIADVSFRLDGVYKAPAAGVVVRLTSPLSPNIMAKIDRARVNFDKTVLNKAIRVEEKWNAFASVKINLLRQLSQLID
jgi:hypothetical protein